MFELILNVLLLLFFVYTLAFNVLEAPIPAKVQRNPYALQPGIWPSVLLVLLIFLVLLNIINIIRKNKGREEFSLQGFLGSVPVFFKSKVFFGILIIVVASFLLEPLGFMVTCFLLLTGYGFLLGDRQYWRLLLVALLVTIVLYVCFGVLLQVNLPRGTVPFLRNFALFLEQLVS
ncbi:MAG: tripartite tricarboxylate transporter TctB family protein [Eubacteriales bacterium]|nr:tripartite tricarboxylate transporter TctB family protein [Eubacteriales bacterium]